MDKGKRQQYRFNGERSVIGQSVGYGKSKPADDDNHNIVCIAKMANLYHF